MANKKAKDIPDHSFFEEDNNTIKEQPANSNNKDSKYGEYYLKNVVYKYKDGINTTVIYNSKEHIYAERNMR
jgi:hypothetical protein